MGDTLDRFMILMPTTAWFVAGMAHMLIGGSVAIWSGAGVGVLLAAWLACPGESKDG